MHVCIFENSQLEGLYVGDLLYSALWGFYTHGDIKGAFIHSFAHSVPTVYVASRHLAVAGRETLPSPSIRSRKETDRATHTNADYKLTSGRRKHQSYRQSLLRSRNIQVAHCP